MFLFSETSRPPLWPSFLFSGYRLTLQVIKLPEREVDHFLAEVKNEWSYTSASPYALIRGQRQLYLYRATKTYVE